MLLKTSTTEMFDPLCNEWFAMPNLKVARTSHSSICLLGTVYVFFGFDFGSKYLNIIESINYLKREQTWEIMTTNLPHLEARANSHLIAINMNQIMIFGGESYIKRSGSKKGAFLKDLAPIILNTNGTFIPR